jgi:hypothetical protein
MRVREESQSDTWMNDGSWSMGRNQTRVAYVWGEEPSDRVVEYRPSPLLRWWKVGLQ